MAHWERSAIVALLEQAAASQPDRALSHARFLEWSDFTGTPIPSILTIVDRFGSWLGAVEAAGLPVNRRRFQGATSPNRGFSEDDCRRAVRDFNQLCASRGVAPTAKNYRVMSREQGWPSFGTLRYRLGRWDQIVAANGGVGFQDRAGQRIA